MDQPAAEELKEAATETPQRRLTLRLGLGVAAAVLVVVPFTALALLVSRRVDWLQRIDHAGADLLHRLVVGNEAATTALVFLQEATQPWRLYLVSGVVLVVLLARRSYRLATWLAVTSGVGWFLGYSLKLVVQRPRPSFLDPVETAPGYSFPSGHAVNSVVFAGSMAFLLSRVVSARWRVVVWTVAGVFVLAVGFDRVALGVHYLSDVLAGWAVGAAVVAATTAAFEAWRRREPRGGVDTSPAP